MNTFVQFNWIFNVRQQFLYPRLKMHNTHYIYFNCKCILNLIAVQSYNNVISVCILHSRVKCISKDSLLCTVQKTPNSAKYRFLSKKTAIFCPPKTNFPRKRKKIQISLHKEKRKSFLFLEFDLIYEIKAAIIGPSFYLGHQSKIAIIPLEKENHQKPGKKMVFSTSFVTG